MYCNQTFKTSLLFSKRLDGGRPSPLLVHLVEEN